MTAIPTSKPIDAAWQARALAFVLDRRSKGRAPTWRELYDHLGWNKKRCAPYWRMQSLRKRGLTWVDDEPHSLDVTDAGRAALAAWREKGGA